MVCAAKRAAKLRRDAGHRRPGITMLKESAGGDFEDRVATGFTPRRAPFDMFDQKKKPNNIKL